MPLILARTNAPYYLRLTDEHNQKSITKKLVPGVETFISDDLYLDNKDALETLDFNKVITLISRTSLTTVTGKLNVDGGVTQNNFVDESDSQ